MITVRTNPRAAWVRATSGSRVLGFSRGDPPASPRVEPMHHRMAHGAKSRSTASVRLLRPASCVPVEFDLGGS
eukprot:4042491-Prymnesium_polylepis.1